MVRARLFRSRVMTAGGTAILWEVRLGGRSPAIARRRAYSSPANTWTTGCYSGDSRSSLHASSRYFPKASSAVRARIAARPSAERCGSPTDCCCCVRARPFADGDGLLLSPGKGSAASEASSMTFTLPIAECCLTELLPYGDLSERVNRSSLGWNGKANLGVQAEQAGFSEVLLTQPSRWSV